MRKFLTFVILFFSLGCMTPKAEAADTDVSTIDNTVYCESQQAAPGQSLSLSLRMKNDKNTSGFQVDIVLPEGFEFEMENGFYVVDLSAARKVSTRTHTIEAELQDDGSLRVLCYSTKSWLFDGNDGEVATVGIKVTENAPAGASTIQLKEMVLTDEKGVTIEASDVFFTVNLPEEESLEDYDLDGDGHVNIADVTKLVNYILEHPELK